MRIKDFPEYADNLDEFKETLEQAEANARTEKEMGFVSDITAKFDQYGAQTYVSEDQLDWLKRIAAR